MQHIVGYWNWEKHSNQEKFYACKVKQVLEKYGNVNFTYPIINGIMNHYIEEIWYEYNFKKKTEFYKKLIKNEKIENTYKNQNYQKSLKNRIL